MSADTVVTILQEILGADSLPPEGPEGRSDRRKLLETEGVRQALRDAGWTRGSIRRWLVEGELPWGAAA